VSLSFAKTSSDSLGTIRNPRARRAGLATERPGSADYERLGFRRTGEREIPGDANDSREYRYEREV
jgi:hypothetical protein